MQNLKQDYLQLRANARARVSLASKLLDVVKVATVVRELPSQSFIYPPTTKFDRVTLTTKKDMRR